MLLFNSKLDNSISGTFANIQNAIVSIELAKSIAINISESPSRVIQALLDSGDPASQNDSTIQAIIATWNPTKSTGKSTWCSKRGILDSTMSLSPLAEMIKNGVISYEEYCLILLSKIWVSDENSPAILTNALKILSLVDCKGRSFQDAFVSAYNTLTNKKYTRASFHPAELQQFSSIVSAAGFDTSGNGLSPKEVISEWGCCFDTISIPKYGFGEFPDFRRIEDIYTYVGDTIHGIFEARFQYPEKFRRLYNNIIVRKCDMKQTIKYGAPGTGKSFGSQNEERVSRVTFHPDSDYSSFVGTYKPRSKDGKIIYEFVPQAFLEAYVKAWCDPQNQYTLIIEEINRGNCATIFGDIFQLLDRDEEGFSRYPITCDTDMWESYLKSQLPNNHVIDGLEAHYKNAQHAGTDFCGEGKMALPPNLSICATMNTSDQSLYKMDSAFKRRWKMEYVPIKYKAKLKEDGTPIEGEEGLYRLEKVHLDFYDKSPWLEILYSINAFIRNRLDSTSKQMGQWFIVPEKEGEDFVDIPFEVFRDKLVFYLFNDVFKKSGILNQPFVGKDEDGPLFLFEDLCTEKDGGKALCEKFLDNVTKDFPYPKD